MHARMKTLHELPLKKYSRGVPDEWRRGEIAAQGAETEADSGQVDRGGRCKQHRVASRLFKLLREKARPEYRSCQVIRCKYSRISISSS